MTVYRGPGWLFAQRSSFSYFRFFLRLPLHAAPQSVKPQPLQQRRTWNTDCLNSNNLHKFSRQAKLTKRKKNACMYETRLNNVCVQKIWYQFDRVCRLVFFMNESGRFHSIIHFLLKITDTHSMNVLSAVLTQQLLTSICNHCGWFKTQICFGSHNNAIIHLRAHRTWTSCQQLWYQCNNFSFFKRGEKPKRSSSSSSTRALTDVC